LGEEKLKVSTLLLFVLKEMGGCAFMLSLMLFFAFRDPVRNLAIVLAKASLLSRLEVHRLRTTKIDSSVTSA
jgi:hypothetical protein